MPIQGFGQYNRLYDEYHKNNIADADYKTVKKHEFAEESEKPQNAQPDSIVSEIRTKEIRTNKIDLENISLTFQKEDGFSYHTSDSELASLDIQKAVSDMKRDNVLAEYQYFVDSRGVADPVQSEDGLIIPKWNI